jgi:hypothetical protein
MKKLLIGFLLLLALVGAAAFLFYKFYLPELVAEALVEEGNVVSMPDFVQKKIEKLRVPVNKNAANIIAEIHDKGIPLSKVLAEIDKIDHDKVNTTLHELKTSNPTNTNEVFNILKTHLNPDIEPFRKDFNKKVNMKMVQKGIRQIEEYNLDKEADLELAKEIAKQVIIRKEAEYQRTH